jgi:uncharacterized membrane protein YfcA
VETIVVCLAAFAASALTLFSGFGLGTLLMPVVAIFFPLELAIAMTAIVHLANNLFKTGLIGRSVDAVVLLRFGLPAVGAALAGALVLGSLGELRPVAEYVVLGTELRIVPLPLVVGLLIIAFVALELSPSFAALTLGPRWLPVGGVISGFFGGLSGHQGAFRSMFLLKVGLDKEGFIATAAALAVMVDLARMLVYGTGILATSDAVDWPLVAAACASAFAGAYLGARLLKKVTIRWVQFVVSALLVLVAAGLIAGVL